MEIVTNAVTILLIGLVTLIVAFGVINKCFEEKKKYDKEAFAQVGPMMKEIVKEFSNMAIDLTKMNQEDSEIVKEMKIDNEKLKQNNEKRLENLKSEAISEMERSKDDPEEFEKACDKYQKIKYW